MGFFTPLLFLSAFDSPEHIEEAKRLGAFDFISKPFQFEKVVETMKKMMIDGRKSVKPYNSLTENKTIS